MISVATRPTDSPPPARVRSGAGPPRSVINGARRCACRGTPVGRMCPENCGAACKTGTCADRLIAALNDSREARERPTSRSFGCRFSPAPNGTAIRPNRLPETGGHDGAPRSGETDGAGVPTACLLARLHANQHISPRTRSYSAFAYPFGESLAPHYPPVCRPARVSHRRARRFRPRRGATAGTTGLREHRMHIGQCGRLPTLYVGERHGAAGRTACRHAVLHAEPDGYPRAEPQRRPSTPERGATSRSGPDPQLGRLAG